MHARVRGHSALSDCPRIRAVSVTVAPRDQSELAKCIMKFKMKEPKKQDKYGFNV